MNNQNHEPDPDLLNDKAFAAGTISTGSALEFFASPVAEGGAIVGISTIEGAIVGSAVVSKAKKNIEEQAPTANQPSEDHSLHDKALAAGAMATGMVAGVGVSATVGGMGLAVAGTAVGIGAAPVAAAGAVVGSAAYGAKKAIEEQDATAIAVVVAGAGVGAGVSATLGGMGLAVAGTAVGVTMAPVAGAGAVVGLAVYGLHKLFSGNN